MQQLHQRKKSGFYVDETFGIHEEEMLHVPVHYPDDEVGKEINILKEPDSPFGKITEDKDLFSRESIRAVLERSYHQLSFCRDDIG
ncbi:MAG: hypothetical protein Q7V05_04535 [Methanoregula sp.]|nr:hypothetical protein [Methanoregula sp.]